MMIGGRWLVTITYKGAAVLAVVACFGWPRVSAAQELGLDAERHGFFFIPTLRWGFLSDDNLFFRPEDPTETQYLRLTPSVYADYRSPRVQFRAGGSFDTELFPAELDELSARFARQELTSDFTYVSSPRMEWTFGAGYLDTLNAGEVILPTGLDFGRRPSQSVTANAGWSRDLTPRHALELQYDFARAELDRIDGPANVTWSHIVSGLWGYAFTPRTSFELGYALRWFTEENFAVGVPGSRNTQSHLFAATLTRRLTGRTTVSLRGGPRYSVLPSRDGAPGVDAERSALGIEGEGSIQHSRPRSDTTLTVGRRQNLAFGVGGLVNTDSLSFVWRFRPVRRVELALSPAAFRNQRAGQIVDSYRAGVDFDVEVLRWLHVTTSYVYSAQNGQFLFADAGADFSDESVIRNTISLSVLVGRPVQLN